MTSRLSFPPREPRKRPLITGPEERGAHQDAKKPFSVRERYALTSYKDHFNLTKLPNFPSFRLSTSPAPKIARNRITGPRAAEEPRYQAAERRFHPREHPTRPSVPVRERITSPRIPRNPITPPESRDDFAPRNRYPSRPIESRLGGRRY